MTLYNKVGDRLIFYFLDGVSKAFELDETQGRVAAPSIIGELIEGEADDRADVVFAVAPSSPGVLAEGHPGSGVSLDVKLDFDPLDGDVNAGIAVASQHDSTGEAYGLNLASATGGTFDLGITGDMRTLGYDDDASTIQTALRDVYSTSGITVIQAGAGLYLIQFHPSLGADTDLEFDDTNIIGSASLSQTETYDAEEPSTFYENYTLLDTPTDWATYSHALFAPAEIVLNIFIERDDDMDASLHLDNIQILPGIEIESNIVGFLGKVSEIPTGQLELAQALGYGPLFATIPTGEMELSSNSPSAVWGLEPEDIYVSKVVYSLTLTGAEDGLEDLEIPMSSFQYRIKSSSPAYMACVVPDSATWLDEVNNRSNGQMVVRKGYEFPNGSRQMEEIARVDFESIRFDRGVMNDSLTIVGSRNTSLATAKDRPIDGVSFAGLQSDGKKRIRATVDLFLRPGDTCIYGDDEIVVEYISYFVSAYPVTEVMEVTGV